MFTQLVTGILSVLGSVPVLLVYLIVAIWIGVDVAGIPLPMEPVLLFVGAMGAVGHATLWLAVASAVLGSMAFASVAYHVGQRFGKPAVTRAGRHVGFTDERADHIELWLRRRGMMGVLITTICPVIRTFSAYIMGIAEVPLLTCALGVFVGSLLYSSLWIIIGRALGANYRAPLRYVDQLGLYGVVVLVAVGGGLAALHHFWGEASRQRVAAHFHRHHQATQPEPQTTLAVASAGGMSAGMTGSALATASLADASAASSVTTAVAVAGPAATMGEPIEPVEPRIRHTTTAAPWPREAWVLLLCFWATGIVLLATMAGSAHRFAEFPPDQGMSTWIQHVRGTPLAMFINLAGDLQWFLPTGVALALILGALLALRLWVEAAFLLLATFGTDLVNVVINTIVSRPRPHGVHITTLVSTFGSASFPSGHVAHTVGLYGFVFFLCLLGIRARPRWKRELIAVQVICVYFILFVGPSRVLEGQHWPSDVAAGYLVGAMTLAATITLYHYTPHDWPYKLASRLRSSPRQAALS